jgi:hypothetical protein
MITPNAGSKATVYIDGLVYWYPGLPDFLVQHTKTGENIPNNLELHILNGHKIPRTNGHKYANTFLCKALQNVPKLGFLV